MTKLKQINLPKISILCLLLYVFVLPANAKNRPQKIAPIKAPFKMPELICPVFQDKDFNIKDFGAVEGGKVLNEWNVQKAIDACNTAGGGRVIIPAGKWFSTPIILKSNVNIHLEEGAELIFTFDKKYFFPDESSLKAGDLSKPISPISGYKCENIAITGKGILNGNGMGWWPLHPVWWPKNKEAFGNEIFEQAWAGLDKTSKKHMRPQMFRPLFCKNLLLEDVTFCNSPFWTVNPVGCENVIIRNIKVKAKASAEHPDSPNTDGINPESCKNVLIENCQIDTGDDSFAIKSGMDEEGRKRGMPSENIVIRNCFGRRVAVGSEMSGGVRNVYIHDCVFSDDEHYQLHIKTRRGRGGIVENVWMENLTLKTPSVQIIRVDMEYWTHKVPAPVEPLSERTPKFRNLHFKNITALASTSDSAIFINGLAEMPIENLTFENIRINSKTGIYCRNANNISFKKIELKSVQSPAAVIKNSEGIVFEKVKLPRKVVLK
jgi:polygalacturonase